MRRPPRRAALRPLLLVLLTAAACGEGGGTRGADGPPVAGDTLRSQDTDAAGGGAPFSIDGHLRAFVDSVRSQEARRLEGVEPVQRPSLTRLVITPAAAPPVVFDDELSGGDLMRLHIFRGRLLQRFVVLEIILYEGGQFVLVDERTGEAHDVDAMPVASPDGTRFVTTSLDLVAGHQPNRIVVYGVTDDGFSREWADEPRDWGPSHAEWLEPGTVRFRVNTIDTTVEPHSMAQSVAWLDLTPNGWRLRR